MSLFWIIFSWICVITLFQLAATFTENSTVENKNDSKIIGVISKKIIDFKKISIAILMIITLLIVAANSYYIVSEQQCGLVCTCGYNEPVETGFHLKWPFLSEVQLFDSTTQGLSIGYDEATNESVDKDSLMITSDMNFINADFFVEYRITDPIAYTYSTSNPEELLKNIGLAAVRNTVGQFTVDEVLTTGKSSIESKVFENISSTLDKYNTGLKLVNVSIQDTEAPTDAVKNAFQAVEDAKQNAQTKLNEAEQYTNEQLPAAEAFAAQTLSLANASKIERINEATEEVATFEALFKEYEKNPEQVKTKLYYDTLGKVLPNMQLVIGKDSKVVYVTGNNNYLADTVLSESSSTTKTDFSSENND